MTGDSVDGAGLRDEVVRLRRRGTLTPLPLGVAMFASIALCVFDGGAWMPWAAFLAFGVWISFAVAKDARRREAVVISRDDETVRSYLRGRLDEWLKRSTRIATALAFAAFMPTLIGAAHLATSAREPADLLLATRCFLFGGALVVMVVDRLFVARPAVKRLRSSLGDAPPSATPAPWLVDVAREIAAAQGDAHAAFFWNEATGVGLRAAKAAVRGLPPGPAPESPPPTPNAPDSVVPAAGPPIEAVRAGVKTLARRDAVDPAASFAILAVLFVVRNWEKSASWSAFASTPWSTLVRAQPVYAGIAAFVVFGGLAQFSLHRGALNGNEASLRTYYRRELEKRMTRVARWSKFEIALVVFAAGFFAIAVAEVVLDAVRARPVTHFADLVVSVIFVAWFIAMPWLSKRRLRPLLERERADLLGPDEPPLIA